MCSAVLRAAIPTCSGSASQPQPLVLHSLGVLDQQSAWVKCHYPCPGENIPGAPCDTWSFVQQKDGKCYTCVMYYY